MPGACHLPASCSLRMCGVQLFEVCLYRGTVVFTFLDGLWSILLGGTMFWLQLSGLVILVLFIMFATIGDDLVQVFDAVADLLHPTARKLRTMRGRRN